MMDDKTLIKELCKKDKSELQYYKGVIEGLILNKEVMQDEAK